MAWAAMSGTRAAAQMNWAPRAATSASWPSTRSRLARSSPCLPDQRAENTPGMPCSASTHSPESSATAGKPVYAAMAWALSRALSANVRPVSATSGAPGKASRPTRPSANPAASRIRDSSAILPEFRVASTTRGAAWSATEGFRLQARELPAPGHRQVQQRRQHRPAERLALRRPLDLHEVPGTGADHVHVRLRRRVLRVAQVEPGLAVHDPDAHRRHRGDQRRALAPPAPLQPGDGVGEGQVTAGHRGGPGAAVGLQHVAVDDDRVLAERLVVHAGPQRAADKAGDLLRPAAEPPLDRLALAPRVRGPGQHRVLGGHPAEPAAPPPARYFFGHARRAQHSRGAELNEHRPLGVVEPSPGKPHW